MPGRSPRRRFLKDASGIILAGGMGMCCPAVSQRQQHAAAAETGTSAAKRVFVAGFAHETNTFHPQPTTSFIIRQPSRGSLPAIAAWKDGGLTVVEGVRALRTEAGRSMVGRVARPSSTSCSRCGPPCPSMPCCCVCTVRCLPRASDRRRRCWSNRSAGGGPASSDLLHLRSARQHPRSAWTCRRYSRGVQDRPISTSRRRLSTRRGSCSRPPRQDQAGLLCPAGAGDRSGREGDDHRRTHALAGGRGAANQARRPARP